MVLMTNGVAEFQKEKIVLKKGREWTVWNCVGDKYIWLQR